MKIFRFFVLFCTVLLAVQGKVSGQSDDAEYYQSKVRSYTTMRNIGIGLTIGGGALTVVGIGLVSDAMKDQNSDDYDDEFDDVSTAFIGIVAIEVGVVMVAGGATLWTIGGAKRAKYSRKLNALSLQLKPDPHKALSLTYKF